MLIKDDVFILLIKDEVFILLIKDDVFILGNYCLESCGFINLPLRYCIIGKLLVQMVKFYIMEAATLKISLSIWKVAL